MKAPMATQNDKRIPVRRPARAPLKRKAKVNERSDHWKIKAIERIMRWKALCLRHSGFLLPILATCAQNSTLPAFKLPQWALFRNTLFLKWRHWRILLWSFYVNFSRIFFFYFWLLLPITKKYLLNLSSQKKSFRNSGKPQIMETLGSFSPDIHCRLWYRNFYSHISSQVMLVMSLDSKFGVFGLSLMLVMSVKGHTSR